jgi:arginase family enzyme
MGLSVECAARFAEEAGRRAEVRHFDIMELSPPHDVDGRTARVAALLFMQFVAGFAERGGGTP